LIETFFLSLKDTQKTVERRKHGNPQQESDQLDDYETASQFLDFELCGFHEIGHFKYLSKLTWYSVLRQECIWGKKRTSLFELLIV